MTKPIKIEAMRIGGKKVSTDRVVNVHYPYTNEIIGTVPAGTAPATTATARSEDHRTCILLPPFPVSSAARQPACCKAVAS